MHPGDVTPEFPLGVLDVAIWAQVLREFYMEGSNRAALGRERMAKLRIEELRRYKECSASEHEYIVTKVRNSEGSYQHLRFERNIRSPTPTPTESANPIASIFNASDTASVASTSSLASILNPPAVDTVTPLIGWPTIKKKGPEALRLIEKIKFSSNFPTLLDLALVAEITHEYSKEYRLFKRQCFWYANVISRTLQEKAPSATIEQLEADTEFDEVQDEAAGTWKRFRVLDVLPKQTIAVGERFQAVKPALLKKISEAGKSWEDMLQRATDYSVQKRLKEEALRREALARKIGEDARKIGEDARKIGEDARKIGEDALKREEDARKRERNALAEKEDAYRKQDDLLKRQDDLLRKHEESLLREQSLRREIEELRRLVMMGQTSKA